MIIFWIYLAVLAIMSVITFFFYLVDKRRAIRGRWRIKEAVLLGLSLFGGAIGGFTAMKVCRHKTSREHWYFTAGNVLFIVLQVAAAIWLLVKCLTA